VSELESGRGNISILRLFALARTLGVPIHELTRFENRNGLIALIGLRGAGKSTVGARLADELGLRFVELDALIEEEAGLGLREIFAMHGEGYYRRLEREVLSHIVTDGHDVVLATGGSLVTDRATFNLLKAGARTVWLRARPEQHLSRVVIEQGDRRPIAGRADPLAELRALLREREPLYAEADVVIDTSELSADAVVRELRKRLEATAAA
jgi:XRE family aerobic/anaerobic benzoate catabolism transcriptional regulator